MAGMSSTDVKFPIRRAPPIPKQENKYPSNSLHDLLTLGNDPFSNSSNRCEMSNYSRDKKKPPPRPPPPKSKNISNKQVLTFGKDGLLVKDLTFGKDGKWNKTAVVKPQPAVPVVVGTLIDLNSPSSSPTFSKISDIISISSSDSGLHNSRSNNSLIESGFEDDFDPFSSNRTTPSTDPWSDPSDPFSPPKKKPPAKSKTEMGQAVKGKQTFISKPTIIRPVKSTKPSRPPPPSDSNIVTNISIVNNSNVDMWGRDSSPPMPSAPAPPPPPEAVAILLNGPIIPPRPASAAVNETPYCIAEYDYAGTHPDDLPFQAGDTITITNQVSEEWLTGRLRGREGMFPINYVNIVVPLEGGPQGELVSMTVIALFPFVAQTWDDLDFNEGDEIQVSRRINENWLYGECGGKTGQFPENFVQDISELFSSS